LKYMRAVAESTRQTFVLSSKYISEKSSPV